MSGTDAILKDESFRGHTPTHAHNHLAKGKKRKEKKNAGGFIFYIAVSPRAKLEMTPSNYVST